MKLGYRKKFLSYYQGTDSAENMWLRNRVAACQWARGSSIKTSTDSDWNGLNETENKVYDVFNP
jgi:hypothetical protein